MKKISKKNGKKVRKNIKSLNIILLVFIFFMSLYLIFNYKSIRNYAIADIQYYGLWALFGLTLLFEFFPQFISPDYTLLFAISLGVNIPYAVIVTIMASSIGSWLAFLIGYHGGFNVIAPFFKEETLKKICRSWGKYGKWFVLAAGTIPLPVPYIPIVFGSLRMSKKDFLLWGIIPRAVGFIATGVVGYYWLEFIMKFI